MGIRIVFGVMSATQSPEVVDQLARLLAPHRVLVHHDFSKRADFELTAPNAEIVENPRETGWGTWGFSDAILYTVEYALRKCEFDYFQLLSPTCLPIRPVEEFTRFVETDRAVAHIDRLPVDGNDDALMTFGYRTFGRTGTTRMRALRKLRGWYFGDDAELLQTQSLSMLRRKRAPLGPRGRAALAVTGLAARGWFGGHPFSGDLRPMIGGVFFGARRSVCERLVQAREDRALLSFVQDLQIVDETLFPTLLCSIARPIGPSNHAINEFTSEGSPRWIEDADLDRLYASGRFFARKFVDDPVHPTRLRTIERLAGASAAVFDPVQVAPARTGAPRVLFALMSSQQPAETVQQLVDALHPHPVLVHHDFTKRQDFALSGSHVSMVPDPRRTGWGTAGFVDAIFHTIARAVEQHQFDYLQLLSPTCLPIRPLEEFLAHVGRAEEDIQADMMPVDEDDDVLMTFAYRTFVPGDSLRFKLMRRARGLYFGSDARLVQTRSLSILKPPPGAPRASAVRRGALELTRRASRGSLGRRLYGGAVHPMIGSVWFGARRPVLEMLLQMRQDARSTAYFNSLHIVDETLIATMLAATGYTIGPSNHSISEFDERGHPRWIGEADLDEHLASGRYFARKFPEDPQSPVRLRALARQPSETLVA